jgi:hypothetical protein
VNRTVPSGLNGMPVLPVIGAAPMPAPGVHHDDRVRGGRSRQEDILERR